jgi:hypothetical protein
MLADLLMKLFSVAADPLSEQLFHRLECTRISLFDAGGT